MNIEDRKHAEDLDAVRRAYQGAARENDNVLPPVAIDDAIRAAARRAVQAGPQPVGKNWLRRWTPQLAVAAVVVLSVSVVMVSVEERPELAPAPVQKITLPRQSEKPEASIASAPPAIISAGKLEMRTQDIAAPSKPAEPPRAKIVAQNMASGSAFVPPPEVQISASQLGRAKKEDRGSAEIDRTARLASGQLAAPPIYAPSPAPAVPVSTVPATTAPAAPLAVSPFPAGAPSINARKEARANSQVAPLPEAKRLAEKTVLADAAISHDTIATAPKAASADAAPSPTVLASAASPPPQAAGAPLPMLKQFSPAVPQRTESSAQLRDQTRAAAEGIRGNSNNEITSADALAKDTRPGPWLKRMLELREQSKLKELREELVQFKKAHPNVVLPRVLAEISDMRQ